jgi:hypothetical protein
MADARGEEGEKGKSAAGPIGAVVTPVGAVVKPVGEVAKPVGDVAKPVGSAVGQVASAGGSAVKQTGEIAGDTGRSVVKETGEIAGDTVSAVSSAGLRAALALAGRHLGIVAAGVGTLVLASAGGYLLGRRRPRPV